MKRVCLVLTAVVLLKTMSAYCQSLIGQADAVHLVERKLADLNGGRFKAESVVYKDNSCIVTGNNGVYAIEALLDARTARVLKISRNEQPYYEWEGIKVIGHRGNVKFAPENTIPALHKAVELGADLVEIDIRQTNDGVLVLMHDDKVDRTTNGQGRIADLPLAEVKKLDAGSWFGDEFKGVRVPTLKEALVAIRGKAMPDIDFKAGDPHKLIELLKEEDLLGKVTLYCGDWDLMQKTAALAPDGFLLRPNIPTGLYGLPIVLDTFDPQLVNVNWKQFSEELVQAIHVSGKKSFLNSMQQDTEFVRELMMSTLPDYLQSDHLDLLVPVLRQQGLHE